MRLAPQLVLAFGLLASVSTAGLGLVVREDLRRDETRRFDDEVTSACTRVEREVARQGESDRKLLAGACQSGELVDRTLVALEKHDLNERRLALAALVPSEREAFDLDELMLLTGRLEVLGADPRELGARGQGELAAALRGDPAHHTLRPAPREALVTRCSRKGRNGEAVALTGARHLGPLLDRLGVALDVQIALSPAPIGGAPPSTPARKDLAEAHCALHDTEGQGVPIVVARSKVQLLENLARIDRTVLVAALTASVVALVLAVLLARSLGRPLAELAREARKVASGEARPLLVRGAGEVGELVQAFDLMIDDLAVTRRRLSATSRVAAWREVARRVAHEVKNPLAPIRAAVETLRRLRARNDPAFDEYFDEATRTVLDEVHRIANIVTEFTRFARLPPPRPQEVEVAQLVRQVVQLQQASAGSVRIESWGPEPLVIRADRDQIVQVLTNLVQNAIDAVRENPHRDGLVLVNTAREGAGYVAFTVDDNGPGVSHEIAARLFEPYATSKAHGTGLGLAIAQRIAIEHGGELGYAGPADGARGARFRLVLPVSGPAEIEDPQDRGSAPPLESAKARLNASEDPS